MVLLLFLLVVSALPPSKTQCLIDFTSRCAIPESDNRSSYVSNHGKLSKIPSHWSNKSPLVLISLCGNQIGTIEKTDFKNLRALISLHLTCNKIRYIDNAAFADTNSLSHLDLGGNKLICFPPLATLSSSLIHLHLDHNHLGLCDADPIFRTDFIKVTHINLSDNYLVSYPSFISRCPYLFKLDLGRHHIVKHTTHPYGVMKINYIHKALVWFNRYGNGKNFVANLSCSCDLGWLVEFYGKTSVSRQAECSWQDERRVVKEHDVLWSSCKEEDFSTTEQLPTVIAGMITSDTESQRMVENVIGLDKGWSTTWSAVSSAQPLSVPSILLTILVAFPE